MKKAIWIFLVLPASFMLFFFGCRQDGGGAGADFDETLYYTKDECDERYYAKSEVDSLLEGVRMVIPAVTEAGQEFSDTERTLTAGNNSFATGVYWVNPNEARAVLFLVYVTGATTFLPVTIDVGVADDNLYPFYFTPQDGVNHYLAYIPLGNSTDEIRAWVSANFPSGATVRMYPVVWFPKS
jgi:hypothetical protein